MLRTSAPAGSFARYGPIALIGVDLVLIALHLALHPASGVIATTEDQRWLVRYGFLLTTEHGFAEVVQYVKTTCVVVLLVLLARGTGWRSGWAWAAVFGWVVLDDSLELHERGGTLFADVIGFAAAGLSPQDLGELAVWGIVGALLAPVMIAAYVGDGPRGRHAWRRLAWGFGLFVAAGGGLDVVHALVDGSTVLGFVLAVAEDGGELLAMSLILVRSAAMTSTELGWRRASPVSTPLAGTRANECRGP